MFLVCQYFYFVLVLGFDVFFWQGYSFVVRRVSVRFVVGRTVGLEFIEKQIKLEVNGWFCFFFKFQVGWVSGWQLQNIYVQGSISANLWVFRGISGKRVGLNSGKRSYFNCLVGFFLGVIFKQLFQLGFRVFFVFVVMLGVRVFWIKV